MMWIYELPVGRMSVVIVAAVFATAGLIYLCVGRMLAPRFLPVLKAISPVTLTPLAVVFGLLTGFLASNVWLNFERAQGFVAREAGELARISRMARNLPDPLATQISGAVRDRVTLAVNEEWPAMAAKRATLASSTTLLSSSLTTILTFEPRTDGERIIQREIVAAISGASDATRDRVLLSQQFISPVKWFVILLLAFLLLLTIAFVHADNRVTQAMTMAIFAASVAGCLILLVSHDHPFVGELSVSPGPLVDVVALAASPPGR